MSLLWGEHSWEEVRDAAAAGVLAVVPLGSVEQHGPMLPLDTDVRIAEKIALGGAKWAWEHCQVRALVLPTLPFGLAIHHMAFAGTITLRAETYLALVSDVLNSVLRHGFRKVAVVTGHGGNEPGIRLALDKVVHETSQTVQIAYFRGHSDPTFAALSRQIWAGEPSEGQPGIHASRWETSETLADRPDLVKREKMVKPVMERTTVPEWEWKTEQLTQTGAFGDPSLSRAELGARTWAAWAEAMGQFLKRLHDEPLNG